MFRRLRRHLHIRLDEALYYDPYDQWFLTLHAPQARENGFNWQFTVRLLAPLITGQTEAITFCNGIRPIGNEKPAKNPTKNPRKSHQKVPPKIPPKNPVKKSHEKSHQKSYENPTKIPLKNPAKK